MNELLVNGTEELNLDTMTDEELDLITTRALIIKQKKAEEKIAEIADKTKKLAEENEINKEKINETSEELSKTKKFMDVLGFAVNSYKLKMLQYKAKVRVYELLDNDTTSVEFMVWSHYFFKKINYDIANHFEVTKCYNINVENYEEACYLAEHWTPTDGYILAKIEEMKNKAINGTLKQERVMALNMYLKNTDDGKINPFAA
jgi:hypothetical protein